MAQLESERECLCGRREGRGGRELEMGWVVSRGFERGRR